MRLRRAVPTNPTLSDGATGSRRWHAVWLLGPVALCTLAGLVFALRALPLTGWSRLLFAGAVAFNVALVALPSWSGVLATVKIARFQRPVAGTVRAGLHRFLRRAA